MSDDSVAAVLPDETRCGSPTGPAAIRSMSTAARFVAPRWDFDDRLWLVDRPGRSTRVRIVEDGTHPHSLVGGLRGLTVRSFALSPDGGRYAVAATDGGGPSLYVGPVRRDQDDRLTSLGDPRRLSIGVDDPHSVDWVSTTRLGFLGASDAGVQLYDVALDGTDLPAATPAAVRCCPMSTPPSWRAAPTRTRPAGCSTANAGSGTSHRTAPGLIDDRRFSGLSTGD